MAHRMVSGMEGLPPIIAGGRSEQGVEEVLAGLQRRNRIGST